MNVTNLSDIELGDPETEDTYKDLRNTTAFVIEGVLLPVLATFGIFGEKQYQVQ